MDVSLFPKHFFHSLILSEDASFYSHKGFDWFEIKESFMRNIVEWKFARGGSTLTQQLAKNLYLKPDKSFSRKFKEFFISKQIEKRLSKSQILEKYVNVVEFGKGIYGLKPASRHYFSKSPEDLNILESLYLVSLLPSPKRLGKSFNTKKLSRSNLWRMKVILKRLYRTHKIKDELYVYIQMLLESYEWPFSYFDKSDYEVEPFTIEDEIILELDDSEFLEGNSVPDDFEFTEGEENEVDHSQSTEQNPENSEEAKTQEPLEASPENESAPNENLEKRENSNERFGETENEESMSQEDSANNIPGQEDTEFPKTTPQSDEKSPETVENPEGH